LITLRNFIRIIILLIVCPTFLSNEVSALTFKPMPSDNEYMIKALQVERSPNIDGLLNEDIWMMASPATHFIQKQPDEGQSATEKTEVRTLYDMNNLYIGIMCFDSEPDRIIANEKRRDSEAIYDNDHIRIMLDTFHDKRNGYIFVTNPLGARLDLQVRKEGKREGGRPFMTNPNVNKDWNGVWDVRSTILPNGWSAEIRIPLRSLRYHEHSEEGWGINFFRNIRRKNEESTWAALPRNLDFHKISLAGVLKGLGGMKKGLNLQLKPYAIANRVHEMDNTGQLNSRNSLDGGIDVKYGLTSNITADITINTDFSQVESDDQQINLTRFSLYYPEKREFFLENSAVFSIGSPEDAMMFFSRRIGLSSEGDEIPLMGGLKIAGKTGRYNLGLINLQTRAKGNIPANNFTVFRLSRDVLGQSALGLMVTSRQSSQSGDYNRAFCVDGDFVFGENLSLNGYLAMTSTPNLTDRNMAGKLGFQWISNFLDIRGYYYDIQDNFNAEMGFVRRTGIRRSRIHIGYTPEPKIPGVKRLNPHATVEYTTDQANRLLERLNHAHIQVELINGGNFGLSLNENREFVDFPFEIQEDITIPVKHYSYTFWRADIRTDKSQNIYGEMRYRWGEFYSGNSKIVDLSVGVRPFSSFNGEVSLVYNDIDLPQGSFVNHLLRSNLIYNFSTHLSLMSLIQWNSETEDVSMNIRLHYIYRAGSDLYFVYNERRLVQGLETGVQDRSIAIKFNYLFNI